MVAGFSVFCMLFFGNMQAQEADHAGHGGHAPQAQAEEKKGFDANKVIFEHVLDAHEFHFLTYTDREGKEHHLSVPLPVILYSPQKGFSCFMSSAFHHGEEEVNGYRLVGGKIEAVDPGVTVYDLSITRNVAQLFVVLTLLVLLMTSIAKKYKAGQGVKTAPKGWQNAMEPIITFIRDDVARPNLGQRWERYMPFLLTVFFFILINALFSLIPGSANVPGNIAFTVVLGVLAFIVILASSNAHYWKHIFNPPVPGGVKPIMVLVEFMSIFTKPFALIIRLFANMLAGHIIIICLISLIFIFGNLNQAVGWVFSPISIGFSVFIYFIELLVAFLQAYIFTVLTAVFIGQAFEGEHHDGHDHEDPVII